MTGHPSHRHGSRTRPMTSHQLNQPEGMMYDV